MKGGQRKGRKEGEGRAMRIWDEEGGSYENREGRLDASTNLLDVILVSIRTINLLPPVR